MPAVALYLNRRILSFSLPLKLFNTTSKTTMKTSTSHYTLSLVAAAVLSVTACGGGGSSDNENDDDNQASTQFITTTVMDGLLQNALVCADINNNKVCDANEPQARTDINGRANLNITGVNLGSTRLLAQVGQDAVDADFGAVTQAYNLATPGTEYAVISPLTTLVQARMDATGENAPAAKDAIKSQLGVSPHDNFVAERDTKAEKFRAGMLARWVLLSAQNQSLNGVNGWTTVLGQLGQAVNKMSAVQCTAINLACDEKIRSAALGAIVTPVTPTTPVTPVTPVVPVTPVAAAQSISFIPPGNQTIGTATSALNATATSGLPVSLNSDTPSVCAVSAGTLALVSAGSCTLTASQAGNTNYRAAANVSVTFTVAVATPVTPVTPVTSAATGKVLYNTAFNGQSCASCHSIMPVLNVSKVLKGANSASTIQSAINSNAGGMGILKGAISTQQLNDIAAYLATPNL